MGVEKRSSCACYISERRETNTSEDGYERVKKTLEKLPESERTVITLYYLGKLPTKKIGGYLGVSGTAVTRRLQKARRLLREDEMRLIQEVLGSVQISASLVPNIMRQVANIKRKSLSVRKRLLFIFSTILVIVIVGGFVFKLLW
ncbi:MAG: sigma-70 family RNA polymerase sigma factor [Candidatus Poribacteria bacterium]|nr:sigma-70 family RNA polymerase sigma factor [Candidatus Poribacteria bacterium]